MVDLGRWINDEYRVAGKPIPSESSDTLAFKFPEDS